MTVVFMGIENDLSVLLLHRGWYNCSLIAQDIINTYNSVSIDLKSKL